MTDWRLDPVTGDLALPSGRVDLVTKYDAIAQDWRLRIDTLKGEWYRDKSIGLDPDALFGDLTPGRELRIKAEVRRETLAVRGLVSVNYVGLDLDRAARQLLINVEAVTDLGEVVPLNVPVDLPEQGAAA